MSKLMKFFAAGALVLALISYAPGNAEARWGGGWHGGGWHGGGWGGWRGPGWRGPGWGWRGAGWGWGAGFAPAFAWGVGPGWGWGPGWGNPYWTAAGPNCGWVRARFWRNGFWVVRPVWRCW
ncbi:MAG TPA: hypothetical protein VEJ43_01970 [Pseudolabrys sp.]|nr:hypothetical protein [Pseudolabrys sp.]